MSTELNPPAAGPDAPGPRSIYLVSYPKIVFLYPTFVMALVAAIGLSFAPGAPPAPGAAAGAQQKAPAVPPGDKGKNAPTPAPAPAVPQTSTTQFTITALFLLVFTINMIVFSFDFPRGTSLALVFFLAAVIFGLLLLFRFNDQILPFLHRVLNAYHPWANATFFYSLATILGLIFLAVLVDVHFDYWEVTPNELLHHHGILSDLERFASPGLKIDKEISDVFEYMLLRSGRLILHPSNNERRAIVLENVLNINKKEVEVMRMLGALQVEFRPASK